jgi:PTH1 family peptidyl-tRNA hydrolase
LKKFNSRIARGAVLGSQVFLGQPQTYMNLSGEAVRALVDYYRIPRSRVLLLVDDADLPLGEIRLRGKGSSGGHHGLESIEHHLGSRDYARLRLGIGRQTSGERQIKDYVLGRFTAEEFKLLERVLARAAEQVEGWFTEGIEMAMTKFNGLIKNTEIKDVQ